MRGTHIEYTRWVTELSGRRRLSSQPPFHFLRFPYFYSAFFRASEDTGGHRC